MLFGSTLSIAVFALSNDARTVVSVVLSLVTIASPSATGAGPAASSPVRAWSIVLTALPR